MRVADSAGSTPDEHPPTNARKPAASCPIGGTWRPAVLSMAVALALLTVPGPTAAAPRGCSVKDAATGATYSEPQRAVDKARPRATLVVRGRCRGATVIRKSLVIQGKRTPRWGDPVLDGGGTVRPVTIRGRGNRIPRVTIRGLTIRKGRATPISGDGFGGRIGGAILNTGFLRLRNVLVTGNVAADGGGAIYSAWGKVRLAGRTRIEGNRTDAGGGGVMCFYCSLRLKDRSSISGNHANDGGGVWMSGLMVLNDRSVVAGNTAEHHGGGVWAIEEGIVLNDSASVRDNSALAGGGIYDATTRWDYYAPGEIAVNDRASISGNVAKAPDGCCGDDTEAVCPSGGGVWADEATVLRMTGAGAITANVAACGSGGVESRGLLEGVVCSPEASANVHANEPEDCLQHESDIDWDEVDR